MPYKIDSSRLTFPGPCRRLQSFPPVEFPHQATLMRKPVLFAVIAFIFFFIPTAILAQSGSSPVVVFAELGFPAADTAAPSPQQFATLFPGAQQAGTDHLRDALVAPTTRLLILPNGSAFPEDAWPAIKQFLDRGGNLLVLGGMPFTRAAYRDRGGWHLRDYSVRCIRPLMIDQYQDTPGSDGLKFEPNPEIPVAASRVCVEARLQPRDPSQRRRSVPPRRRRRLPRRPSRHARLGRQGRPQALGPGPASRSLPQRF